MAHVLGTECILLAADFGLEKLGFFTLTPRELLVDIKEGQRRFHSLCTNVIKPRYKRALGVWERMESGRIHFHLAVVLDADIRTGCDFDAFERRDYRSANQALRAEWAFWRRTAPLYGWGRHELLPIKSTAEGAGRYMGKYVSKHIGKREERDKGARVVRFIGYPPGTRHCTARFSWATDNGWLWRMKVKAFCESHSMTFDELRKISRWAWKFKDAILGMAIADVFPSEAVVHQYLHGQLKRQFAEDLAQRILDSKQFTRTYLLKRKAYNALSSNVFCGPSGQP